MPASASLLPSSLVLLGLGALATLLVLLTVAAVVRKALGRAASRRRERRETAARPVLFRLLAGGADERVPGIRGRGAAAHTLESVARGLLPKLRGEDRLELVRLLERHGTIQAARRNASRPGPVRRARSVELLGLAGDGLAFPELTSRLADRSPEVRAVAARALGRLGDPAAVPFLLIALSGRRRIPAGLVSMSLLHIGPAAVERLRDGLRADSPTDRALVVELLGQFGDLGSTDAIIQALRNDPVPAVRVRAAGALGHIGSPRALPELTASLGDDQPTALRAAAARALGEIGGAAAIGELHAALGSGVHELAHNAALALTHVGEHGSMLLHDVALTGGPGAAHAREALTLRRLTTRRPSSTVLERSAA